MNEIELREFLQKHNIGIKSESESGNKKILHLNSCVFCGNNDSGKLLIYQNGGIGYKCNHNSCKDKNIGDFIKKFEPNYYKSQIVKYSGKNKTIQQSDNAEPIVLQELANTKEEPVEWLVSGYIPKGQITLIVGDGGSGKTVLWCNILAAITTGNKSLFDMGSKNPFIPDGNGQPALFFSSEDSVPKVLKGRLKAAGADESKLRYLDLTDEEFERIKFDSEDLEKLIAENKPAAVVFDPLQAFIPPDIQMGSRNAMRQCMSPLAKLGELYGTTFLIIMHTNKKQGVYGRTRCADSADIWDIARSVLIVGKTNDDEVRYISHEKSNYGELQQTVLFSISGEGKAVFEGVTDKKDRDYVQENSLLVRAAPARDEAKTAIIDLLKDAENHEMIVSDLDNTVKAQGVTQATLRNAKQALTREGVVAIKNAGMGKDKRWTIRLLA